MNNNLEMYWNCMENLIISLVDRPRTPREITEIDMVRFKAKINRFSEQQNGEIKAGITLRYVCRALEELNYDDQNVRKRIHKLMRSICKLHPFSQVVTNAQHFHSALLKASESRVDTETRPERVPLLKGEYHLEEILSTGRLIEIGQKLQNCVQCRTCALDYMKEVQTGLSKLWLLSRRNRPVALLRINLESNEIEEFDYGRNGRRTRQCDFDISGDLLTEILDVTGASGDELSQFVHFGVFGSFKGGNRPKVDPIRIDNYTQLWIWLYPVNEIIMLVDRDSDDSSEQLWSRLKLDKYSPLHRWRASPGSYLNAESLVQLMLENKQVYEKLLPILTKTNKR